MRAANLFGTITLGVAILALSGCGLHKGACGSDKAKTLVTKAIGDEVDKAVPTKIQSETPAPPQPVAIKPLSVNADPNAPAPDVTPAVVPPPPPAPPVAHSAIRRLIDGIVVTIDDIRTNGSVGGKTACSASVSLRFPVAVLNAADAERRTANQSSLSELADAGQIDAHGDTYVAQVNYNVQETDDKSKLFTEVEKFNKLYDFAAEVVTANLIRPLVDTAQAANRTTQAAATAAQTELKAANLNAAKTNLQLAVQTINAVWQSIDPPVKQRLLPLQKAWWKQAVAQCKVDAAGTSTDPMVVAANEAECQAKANQQRASWLGQFRGAGGQGEAQNAPGQGAQGQGALGQSGGQSGGQPIPGF